MKRVYLITFIALCFIIIGCGPNSSNEIGTMELLEVKINNQIWAQKNLDVDHFVNGDKIFQATSREEWQRAQSEKIPAWAYLDSDENNGEKYGKLYNWYAVNDPRGLAPDGWRIPTKADFELLISNLGGYKEAIKKLKSIDDWGVIGGGTNESGFSALPAGAYWAPTGSTEGELTYFWTATEMEDDDYAFFMLLLKDNNDMMYENLNGIIGGQSKGAGHSVRLIKKTN